MGNTIKPVITPDLWRLNSPVYDHFKYGWHTPNMSRIQDCVPHYTNPSPTHPEKRIGTLEEAMEQSILYMDQRITVATEIKKQMLRDLEELRRGR